MYINQASERLFYLVLVLTVAGLLSFRPIPIIFSSNDTGRYVADFNLQCGKPVFDSSQLNVSQLLFYALLRPICWTGENRIFMFMTVLAVPFAFLLFAKWGKDGLLWSLAALFSVAGFELATNALKQGMGLFFLLFAIRLILDDRRFLGFVVGVLAAFIHSSNIAYFPLLFWFAKFGYKKRGSASEMALFVVLPIIIVSGLSIVSAWVLSDYLVVYQVYYKGILSTAFMFFVSLPILYTFAVRKKITSHNISNNEIATFVYSSILLIATLIFFPAIAYRFAFTSCILQLFMTMAANDSNVKQGIYVLVGMLTQLCLYFIISRYPMKVLFG